ncbi:MAG: 30S ribosomal protein S17 [Patescibacteria group bacterium]
MTVNKTKINQSGKHRRQLSGVVLSNKMNKTVVVSVVTVKLHPKYKKHYKVSKKYKAHDAKQEYHIGDKVVIEACRPISKDKTWRVIKKNDNSK